MLKHGLFWDFKALYACFCNMWWDISLALDYGSVSLFPLLLFQYRRKLGRTVYMGLLNVSSLSLGKAAEWGVKAWSGVNIHE